MGKTHTRREAFTLVELLVIIAVIGLLIGMLLPADRRDFKYHQYGSKTWSADGLTPNGPCTVNCNNNWGIYAFHVGGANILLCDGSIHFVAKSLDRDIFAGLVTKAGAEVIVLD